MGFKKDWSNKNKSILQPKPIIDKKISTATLSNKIRPVAFQIFEFDNQQIMNMIGIFAHFRTKFQIIEQNRRLFTLRVI